MTHDPTTVTTWPPPQLNSNWLQWPHLIFFRVPFWQRMPGWWGLLVRRLPQKRQLWFAQTHRSQHVVVQHARFHFCCFDDPLRTILDERFSVSLYHLIPQARKNIRKELGLNPGPLIFTSATPTPWWFKLISLSPYRCEAQSKNWEPPDLKLLGVASLWLILKINTLRIWSIFKNN